MKCNDCYGKDREMILEYRCTMCGDTETAEEFEREELEMIELVLDEKIYSYSSNFPHAEFDPEPFEKLLEKVRKM